MLDPPPVPDLPEHYDREAYRRALRYLLARAKWERRIKEVLFVLVITMTASVLSVLVATLVWVVTS